MKRWDIADLANALSKNPNVRISRSERFKALYGVDPLNAPLTPREAVKVIRTDITRPRKYRNEVVSHEDGKFDSKKELQRWIDLKLLERAGEIKNLERQVKISIDVNGHHICNYFADFQYHEKIAGRVGKWRIVVEDCKSPATRKLSTYRLKKKLVAALFSIDILET